MKKSIKLDEIGDEVDFIDVLDLALVKITYVFEIELSKKRNFT